jgi:membrane protein implicated in regulation of membrane protease activity
MIEVEPWHWAAFGLILSLVEIFLPSFVFLLIGLAAVATGGVAYFIDLPTYQEILIFAGMAAVNTLAWFRIIKPRIGDNSSSDDLQTEMNTQLGYVTFNTEANQTGKLRFNIPVEGKEVWDYRCETPLKLGETVRVIKIEDPHLLIVGKTKEALL